MANSARFPHVPAEFGIEQLRQQKQSTRCWHGPPTLQYVSHRFALFGVLGLALFAGDVAALLLVVAVLLRHVLALALVLGVALQVVRALLRGGDVSCTG